MFREASFLIESTLNISSARLNVHSSFRTFTDRVNEASEHINLITSYSLCDSITPLSFITYFIRATSSDFNSKSVEGSESLFPENSFRCFIHCPSFDCHNLHSETLKSCSLVSKESKRLLRRKVIAASSWKSADYPRANSSPDDREFTDFVRASLNLSDSRCIVGPSAIDC